VAGVGTAERVRVAEATPSLFTMLGAQTVVGRWFATAADGRADPSQVVLSHQFWQRTFGGARDVVGRPLRIDGQPYRVVGVASPAFAFPDREVMAYIPLDVPPVGGKNGQGGTISMFLGLAKLRPGATPAQAAAEATARGRSAPDPGLVTMAVFGSKGPVRVSAVPLLDAVVGEVRPALVVFLVAVGLLLAVATANVASLQLARATSRRREIAIRSALGAGGAQLARQLLVENLVVGQVGGLAGLLLAAALVRLLPALAPADFPRLAEIGLDWRAAILSVGVSLAASLAFGLAPALQARSVDVASALAEDGLAPVGGHRRSKTARARMLIMVGQVATAAILLVGAVLLARSFVALMHADRGYNPSNLLTAQLALPDDAFPPRRRTEVLDRLMERLRAVPGVSAAAYSTRLPLAQGGEILTAFPVPARKGGGTVSAHAALRQVSPGFFAALGLRMHEGRGFSESDTRSSREVVVVNRAFARQYLDAPAVGTQFPASKGVREVIGVIEDANYGTTADAVFRARSGRHPGANDGASRSAHSDLPGAGRRDGCVGGSRAGDDHGGSGVDEPGAPTVVRHAAGRIRGVRARGGGSWPLRRAELHRVVAGARDRGARVARGHAVEHHRPGRAAGDARHGRRPHRRPRRRRPAGALDLEPALWCGGH
jgi:predicted permease